jgi:hypothetical protein
VLPDLDGFGLLYSWEAFFTYHHVLCHNLLGCVVWAFVPGLLSHNRLRCVTLAVLNWHLHLACDYFGSRGPMDTPPWVLPYLYPFVGGWSDGEFVGPAWYWNPWQWPLNGWPNFLVTVLGAAMWVYVGVRLDRTWFEFISPWFDGEVCKMLRRWFGGGPPAGQWSPAEARWMRRAFLAVTCAAVFACVVAGARAVGSGVRA